MKYRYLEEGEIVEAGDEINIFADSWMPVNQSIGQKAPPNAQSQKDLSIYPKYRRAITMKYDILKPVSVESVGKVCREAGEKLAFWILGNGYSVGFGTILVETTIAAMPDNFRAWLVEHGFIRLVKEFEPFDIRVETAEECRELWKRLNYNGPSMVTMASRGEMEKTTDSRTLYHKIEPHYYKLEDAK